MGEIKNIVLHCSDSPFGSASLIRKWHKVNVGYVAKLRHNLYGEFERAREAGGSGSTMPASTSRPTPSRTSSAAKVMSCQESAANSEPDCAIESATKARSSAPSATAKTISPSLEHDATRVPSGEKRGNILLSGPDVNCRGAPPSVGSRYSSQ